MTALYLFAAAAGTPLVAWFVLSGGDDGAEGGSDGIGGIMVRLLPLSSLALAAAVFGICGLILGAVGAGAGTTFLGSLLAGGAAGALNSAVFSWLRQSEKAAVTDDAQLVGSIGRVVLPVAAERRGRIAVVVDGQQRYLSALALPGRPGEAGEELDVGAPVLVVEVHDGIAAVTRLAPELT